MTLVEFFCDLGVKNIFIQIPEIVQENRNYCEYIIQRFLENKEK